MNGRCEAARAVAAKLIGGGSDEIVFTRNATEAINLVASSCRRTGATAFCFPSSSTVRTSCPGSSPATQSTSADHRRRPHRPRRRRRRCSPNSIVLSDSRTFQRVRLDPRRQARSRHRPFEGRPAAARRMPGGAAHPCTLRPSAATSTLCRPQLYGPTGIGALGSRRIARGDAALSGRRRDDRQRHVRTLDVPSVAAAVRGGDAAHRRRGRSPRGYRLGQEIGLDTIHAHEPRRSRMPQRPTGRRRGPPVRPRGPAGIVSFAVDGVIRTTSAPSWTMKGSRSAPGTIAPSP